MISNNLNLSICGYLNIYLGFPIDILFGLYSYFRALSETSVRAHAQRTLICKQILNHPRKAANCNSFKSDERKEKTRVLPCELGQHIKGFPDLFILYTL